jgi:hypothetical protein
MSQGLINIVDPAGQVVRTFDLDTGESASDGFHTFDELYDHRRALTAVMAAYAAQMPKPAAWRSKAHHPDDSPMFEGGYFIVGIELDTGTITYHYKLTHWDDFAAVPELDYAKKWDGASPADSVTRLLDLAMLFSLKAFGQ